MSLCLERADVYISRNESPQLLGLVALALLAGRFSPTSALRDSDMCLSSGNVVALATQYTSPRAGSQRIFGAWLNNTARQVLGAEAK